MISGRLFAIASATSLLASLAAVAQLVVARSRDDNRFGEVAGVVIGLNDPITIFKSWPYLTQTFSGKTDARWAAWQVAHQTHRVGCLGVDWESGHLLDDVVVDRRVEAHDNGTYKCLTINPWTVVAVGCVLPVRWFWLYRRRPVPPGACRRCNYDLTGNASGVCSECGMAINGEGCTKPCSAG